MHDTELVLEILRQIEDAAQKVVQRFQVINNPNDFTEPKLYFSHVEEKFPIF